MANQEIYDRVFGSLTDQLANAETLGQWQRPWREAAQSGYPQNPTTGRVYRGVNVLSLWSEQVRQGYERSLWAGYGQWKKAGGQVRRGEKGTPVLIWRVDEKEEQGEDGETAVHKVIFATMQQVFNICQQAGYPLPERPPERQTDAELDRWFADTGAKVVHHGGGAYYRPSDDTIRMPRPENFIDTSEADALGHYYATLSHEAVHFTGHPSRLNRFSSGGFNTEARAMEELTAEIGAAFLSALHGLPVEERQDHARYLASWRQAVRDKAGALLSACSKAQKAVDYLSETVGKVRGKTEKAPAAE